MVRDTSATSKAKVVHLVLVLQQANPLKFDAPTVI